MGSSTEQRVQAINARPEPLDDGVPLELRRIVDDALDPDPTSRTPDPETLRASLASFLQHRGAIRLSGRADRERERFVLALESGDDVAAEEVDGVAVGGLQRGTKRRLARRRDGCGWQPFSGISVIGCICF